MITTDPQALHWEQRLTSQAPLLDKAVLSDLVGGDEEVVQALLADFSTEFEHMATELDGALARNDAVASSSIAHKLKSASRAVGALQLATLCEAIERPGSLGFEPAVAREHLHAQRAALRVALPTQETLP